MENSPDSQQSENERLLEAANYDAELVTALDDIEYLGRMVTNKKLSDSEHELARTLLQQRTEDFTKRQRELGLLPLSKED